MLECKNLKGFNSVLIMINMCMNETQCVSKDNNVVVKPCLVKSKFNL
jgi:hypothetical protein